MQKGTLFIISAPSGAGKSSLIKEFIKIYSSVCKTKVSISHTTRTIRPGEYHGKHYFFVSIKKFKKMIENNAFLEYAKVFGNYYGTSKHVVENILMSGYDIFLDIDWQGANQIHKKIPGARKIFILPPSKEELNRRLNLRGQDSKEIIFNRMSKAISEMVHFEEYDYLIINDNFYTALLDLKNIVCAEKLRLKNQKINCSFLIEKLLKN